MSWAETSYRQNEIDPGSKPDAFVGLMSEINVFGRYDYISYETSQEFYRNASKVFINSTAFTQMHGKEIEKKMTKTNFLSRLGEFVFGGPIDANESDECCSHNDYGHWASDDEDNMSDYMPDGIFPRMDLYEPAFDPFGYHANDQRDYQAYKAYQEFQLNGGKEEGEIKESHIHYSFLGFWIRKIMDMSTKKDDMLSPALSRIGEVAPQIPSADFHSLWIPLLKEMAPKMSRIILERSKDPNTQLWRKNIYALVKAYLDICVGQWPRRPSLAQGGVGCGCADCKGLNVFLADASLKIGHFSASIQRCKHLIDELFKGGADVYAERKNIEGAPEEQKLTVVKSRTKMRTRARIAWKERRDEAAKQLGSFEQKHLAAVMGPEWMTLFSMAHLGGPSLSDMDMRKALRIKTEKRNIPRAPPYMEPSTIAMFFGGGSAMTL